jgi:hypothetical protein
MIRIYYILNVVLQIWLLSLFLGTNFLRFGYESVKLFRHGLNQPESKYFPRETFCDFHVREPLRGGEPLQRITVQCVLTVNLFNQVNNTKSNLYDFRQCVNNKYRRIQMTL